MIVSTRRLDPAGATAVVVAEGKLSGHGASDRLRRALLAATDRYDGVVADLLKATDLGPASLGALAEAAATARMAGKKLAVAAAGEIAEAIAGLGFAEALNLRESVEAAGL
jgi:anti-anti-sigma regulatory factor